VNYLALFATILLTRTAQFAVTVGGKHLQVTISDKGAYPQNGAPLGRMTFQKAAVLTGLVLTGQTGTFDQRVGGEVLEVNIQQLDVAAAPPMNLRADQP
jgi:hypothetical protein